MRKVKITVKTKDLTRLINKLKKFSIRHIEKKDGKICFIANETDKEQILDILSHSLYNNCVCEELSYKKALEKRKYLLSFLIAFAIVSLLPFFFIFRVDIKCDESVSEFVEKTIDDSLKIPMLQKNVDTKKLRDEIMSIKGVSFCEVSMLFGKLEVEVQGSEKAQVEESVFEIKSEFNGVITRAVVFSGRLNVKIGDCVKKGDTLIDGFVVDERSGRKVITFAKGEVYGLVTTKRQYFLPRSQIRIIRTGQKHVCGEIELFGKSFQNEPPYEYFELIEKNIDVFGILPIRVKRKEYFECVAEEKETDIELEKAKIIAKERKKAEEGLYEIKSIETSVVEAEEGFYLEVTVTAEKRMG